MEIIFFVLGAIVASFIGVLVARINTGQSFLTGRSRCDACHAPPFVAFARADYLVSCVRREGALLRQPPRPMPRSRNFYSADFSRLPIPHSASQALFRSCFLRSRCSSPSFSTTSLIRYCRRRFSPYSSRQASRRASCSPSLSTFLPLLIIALLIAMSLALIHFFSRGRAMGLADAPLAFGLALLAGPAALSGFIFSFWVGALVGIALLLRRPAGSRMGVEVPFAPFLAAGFLLAYFTQWNPLAFVAASL